MKITKRFHLSDFGGQQVILKEISEVLYSLDKNSDPAAVEFFKKLNKKLRKTIKE